MAKKEGESSETLEAIKSMLKQTIATNIVSKIKDYIQDQAERFYDNFKLLQQKLLESIVAALVFVIGLVFLLVGTAIFLNNKYALESHWGFLIIGAIVVLVAWFFKEYIRKTTKVK